MKRLRKNGVDVSTQQRVTALEGDQVMCQCVWTGEIVARPADALVVVGNRAPNDMLFRSLRHNRRTGSVR